MFVILALTYTLSKSVAGFRGEAIGGRTGGSAYSDASPLLDPGMP